MLCSFCVAELHVPAFFQSLLISVYLPTRQIFVEQSSFNWQTTNGMNNLLKQVPLAGLQNKSACLNSTSGTARCSSGGPSCPWQQLNFPVFTGSRPPSPTAYTHRNTHCLFSPTKSWFKPCYFSNDYKYLIICKCCVMLQMCVLKSGLLICT